MASLEELRRQRELVAEHLEWLDREIAAAGGSSERRVAPEEAKPAVEPEVPKRYLLESEEARDSARKGCLLGVAFLVLSLLATLAVIYWFFYRQT